MAGHSKWAQIKRQKGVADVKRGQQFSKLSRSITIAAKQGGTDPDANPRLKIAIEAARAANMPKDNIARAIEKATGTGAEGIEEVVYEGYGPGGAALHISALTDNRNRTVSELRSVLGKHGGTLSEAGSVAWMFNQQAVISIEIDPEQAEAASLTAIEAGATDLEVGEDGQLTVLTDPARMTTVEEALHQFGAPAADLQLVPTATIELDEPTEQKLSRLMEALEDLDDVSRVTTNASLRESAA